MSRIRVFYGHGASVPPTGLRAREAAPAPAAEVEAAEVETPAAEVEAAEVAEVETPAEEVEVEVSTDDESPDESWSHSEIDAYAEAQGIDLDGAKKKSAKLAFIADALKGD